MMGRVVFLPGCAIDGVETGPILTLKNCREVALMTIVGSGQKKGPTMRGLEFYVRKKGMVRLFIYYQNTDICE